MILYDYLRYLDLFIICVERIVAN